MRRFVVYLETPKAIDDLPSEKFVPGQVVSIKGPLAFVVEGDEIYTNSLGWLHISFEKRTVAIFKTWATIVGDPPTA